MSKKSRKSRMQEETWVRGASLLACAFSSGSLWDPCDIQQTILSTDNKIFRGQGWGGALLSEEHCKIWLNSPVSYNGIIACRPIWRFACKILYYCQKTKNILGGRDNYFQWQIWEVMCMLIPLYYELLFKTNICRLLNTRKTLLIIKICLRYYDLKKYM